MTAGTRRCTYCRETTPAASFRQQGDHIIPAANGGAWVDPDACDECNATCNRLADQMVTNDPLVRFLREAYRIPDRRHGEPPPPCKFSVRVPEGGVVHVTLTEGGPTFQAAMAPAVAESLGLGDPPDQKALEKLAAKGLGLESDSPLDALGLARAAQQFAAKPTPPDVWSRFMAKIGLACGRAAYGDAWLDTPHAARLSQDLLGEGQPHLLQRTHYPPVELVWPFEPPKHQIWIEPRDGVSVLMIALFGQVIGAVPINDEPPPAGAYSAWTLDPLARSVTQSSFPAVWLGTAAARMTAAGHNVVMVASGEHPFVFVEDGPDGPAEIPVPTTRAESPTHALKLVTERIPGALEGDR
jgi:hypothetical protein